MNAHSTWTAAALALVLAAPAFAADTNNLGRPAAKDWPMVAGDWGNSRYSALSQINTTNVKQLGGAWVHKLDGETSRATPVVVDGLMFITAGTHVVALNPKTGETVWSYVPAIAPTGLYKGVAVGEGLVFVGLSDSQIIALKEKTGELVWSHMVGDTDAPSSTVTVQSPTGQFISAAPAYAAGLVITGLSNGDYGIRGRVVALDAKTGKQAWRFDTIPGPGETGHDTWPRDNDEWKHGGGGVWSTPAVDPDLGMVYFGVGNPVPQWGGELRGGDDLFSDSAVALDLKTGKLRWYYQVVHHDLWEQDLGTPLVLYTADVDGKTRKALGAMRTDGYLFLLDRLTGKPVFPVEERPVPQNARLKTAPTQPFPVGADEVGPNCVQKDAIPAGFKAACHFDPIDFDTPNAMYPVLTTRSSPMAYSPETHYFYAAGSPAWPLWIKRLEDPKFFIAGNAVPGIKTSGILAAIDSRTDKIVWQKQMPYEIQNGSGLTATAGGLLFHGEPDGNLQAYDAKTGDLLWQFQTGANESGPASIYEVGGKEYVSVLATGAVWTFTLGGTLMPLPAPPPPATVSAFNGRLVRTDQITISPTVGDTGLGMQRHAVDEYAFQPVRVRVSVGDKVTWTNKGKLPHDATAIDGSWSTGEIAPGQSATVTFDKPGTYTYICKDHPWSYGELIVQ